LAPRSPVFEDAISSAREHDVAGWYWCPRLQSHGVFEPAPQCARSSLIVLVRPAAMIRVAMRIRRWLRSELSRRRS
jgi:hypothetical protein